MNATGGDRIGIIGAGRLGQAMARTAVRAGRPVVISNSRGPDSLSEVVSSLGSGAAAGTVEEAASAAIVVIAVPWDRVAGAVKDLDWSGRIVIDATNDWEARDLDGKTSSELVADLVAGARVVKAANTLGADVLGADPHEGGGRRVIFISGDDGEAKEEVSTFFERAGFSPVDLGGLAGGGELQQIHHPLAGLNLIRLDEASSVARPPRFRRNCRHQGGITQMSTIETQALPAGISAVDRVHSVVRFAVEPQE